MPLDPRLIDRVFRAPRTLDVGDTPIVTAIILQDPANAETLVPFLDDPDSTAAVHARQILSRFTRTAAPFLMRALADDLRSADGRAAGLDMAWSMLLGEAVNDIRSMLREVAPDARVLLHDKRPVPDRAPPNIERDFHGRVCDRAYVVFAHLMNPKADLSLFRSFDDDARDQEIRRFEQRVFGGIA